MFLNIFLKRFFCYHELYISYSGQWLAFLKSQGWDTKEEVQHLLNLFLYISYI